MSSARARTTEQETWDRREFPPAARWALLAAVGVLACLPFWSATQQGFVAWDDDIMLENNPYWRGLSAQHLQYMFQTTDMGHYQPLSWLSYAVEFSLWGLNAQRMHLVNIVLHALNAVLFLRLATRLLAWGRGASAGAEPASAWLGGAAAALFFALHPLRVESVAWATERRDVLSSFFLLATVLCWLHTRDDDGRSILWWAATLSCYALSLLSKAWGMTLPAVLILLDVFPLRRVTTWRDLRASVVSMWPFAPLALWCAWKAHAAQSAFTAEVSFSEHGLLNRAAQASWGIAFYLGKTIWPTGLAPLYELEEQFDPWARGYVIAMAVVAALCIALIALRKRFPAGLAAWLAFLILVSPVLGLLQSGAQKAADRYTYLACLPFAVLLGAGVLLLVERRALRVAAAAVIVPVLGALGWAASVQTRVWKDSESLWRRVVAVEPESYIAHHNLAATIGPRGGVAEAIELEKRSVELRPGKGNVQARHYLGSLQLSSGKADEALETWIASFKVDPEFGPVIQSLEGELTRRGQHDRLFALFEEAIAADPKRMLTRLQYATRLYVAGRTADAEKALKAALAIDPRHQQTLVALGRVYVLGQRALEAEPLLQLAVRQDSSDPEALTELGALRALQNRMQEAALLWEQAHNLAPDNPRLNTLLRQYRMQ